jgi:N-acetyltransferase
MTEGLEGPPELYAGPSDPMAAPRPITLVGELVRMEPLTFDHLGPLTEIGLEPSVWRWMLVNVQDRDDMQVWVEAALRAQGHGTELPFVVVERATDRVVGSMRYLSIVPEHRRLEIGHSWLAPAWRGTGINTEAKLLLLAHAFETLGARRVEFKTDSLNERARGGLAAIGATEEGIFRNHMISQGGRRRHSVYFSVIDSEWPAVREHLLARLGRPETAQR